MRPIRSISLLTGVAAAIAISAAASTAGAQQKYSARDQDEARSQEKVVVYPVVFSHNTGDETSRRTGVRSVEEAVERAGFTLISGRVAANTWRRMGMAMPTDDDPVKKADLVRFGEDLHARYVVTPTIGFHSRSIWVDLGPKTVSTASVDIKIVDVHDGSIVYNRVDVQGRSDEKFDVVKAGADVLLTPLVTIVSGGPKTPHEQRAVQIAVAKAMRDWVRPVATYDVHEQR